VRPLAAILARVTQKYRAQPAKDLQDALQDALQKTCKMPCAAAATCKRPAKDLQKTCN